MKTKKPNLGLRIAGLVAAAAVAGGLSLAFANSADRTFVRSGSESFSLYALTMGCLATGAAALWFAATAAIEIVADRKAPPTE